jgi:hypothetical protein
MVLYSHNKEYGKEKTMKETIFRHVCIEFKDAKKYPGIAIRTLNPVKDVVKVLQRSESWKNGVVPEIDRVWVEHW